MTREEAIDELSVIYERLSHTEDCANGVYSFADGDYLEALDMAIEALSEEPPYQYSKAYVEQIRGERDILQDMVDNMAKPKTEMVLCALADRVCPFQGREFAWCLTCPHISEEDRALVKKAVAEPKTWEWIPVSERLPDLHKTVIYSLGVETYDGETYTGYRTDRNYSGEVVEPYWADMETGIEVFPNAWMPLPEPYKGGDNE